MRSLLLILARWIFSQIGCLGWRQFMALIADTIQKLGIAGLALGIYQDNEKAIGTGMALILVSGVLTLLLNRSKK